MSQSLSNTDSTNFNVVDLRSALGLLYEDLVSELGSDIGRFRCHVKEEDDLRRRSFEGEMYESVEAQYQRRTIFQSLRDEKGLADGAWDGQLLWWPYGCDFHLKLNLPLGLPLSIPQA
jgi:hypothetical protein